MSKIVFQILFSAILVSLSLSCSFLSLSREFEIPKAQVQQLKNQIKLNQFEQIYLNSSESVQSKISKERFVYQINQAVEKLKEVDETLDFQDYTNLNPTQNLIENRYNTGNIQKIEKDGRKIAVLFQWNRNSEKEDWKFSSCSLIESFTDGQSKQSIIPQ